MYISGFTFVRNALQYDYPVLESIQSMLALCTEVIVCVGNSTDNTLQLIQSLQSPKIKIIHSTWDDSLRKGGTVLAQETNKALAAINSQAQWAIYLQADEVIPEFCIPNIQQAMKQYVNQPQVQGLLFKYLHFYATYDYLADSRRWYSHEVRIVRPHPLLHSYKDAQGFRLNNQKLTVKPIDAYIYHYGWVKPPTQQQHKHLNFNKYWHSDEWVTQHVGNSQQYNYKNQIDSVKKFEGTHPQVMQKRIDFQRKNWQVTLDTQHKNMNFKNKLLYVIEQKTGKRLFEYKNYTLL